MANIALVDTVADLRNINGSMIEACCQVRAVRLSGYYTATDGAGGPILIWDATSTAADDGLSVFQPTGVTTGRWIRQLQDEPSVNVLWGGAVGDDVADDSVAVQNAYNYVNSNGGGTVLFPGGKKFKLVSFVEMFSNTTTWVLGTVDCYNKAGGLYAYQQKNVHVYGFGSGLLTDSTITSGNFIFNQINYGPNYTVSPCIHFRGCTQCSVNDINIIYCTVGIWSSNCTANSFPNTLYTFSGTGCTQVAYRNINLAYSEGDGLLAHNSIELCWTGGKVYRSADGGIVMFSCGLSFIGGGMIRESPYGNGSSTAINEDGVERKRCKKKHN